MKSLKLRLVKIIPKDENGDFNEGVYYLIQRKTFFGWRYYTFTVSACGGSVVFKYSNTDRVKLLAEVLDKVHSTTLKYVTITEYPELTKY